MFKIIAMICVFFGAFVVAQACTTSSKAVAFTLGGFSISWALLFAVLMVGVVHKMKVAK